MRTCGGGRRGITITSMRRGDQCENCPPAAVFAGFYVVAITFKLPGPPSYPQLSRIGSWNTHAIHSWGSTARAGLWIPKDHRRAIVTRSLLRQRARGGHVTCSSPAALEVRICSPPGSRPGRTPIADLRAKMRYASGHGSPAPRGALADRGLPGVDRGGLESSHYHSSTPD